MFLFYIKDKEKLNMVQGLLSFRVFKLHAVGPEIEEICEFFNSKSCWLQSYSLILMFDRINNFILSGTMQALLKIDSLNFL